MMREVMGQAGYIDRRQSRNVRGISIYLVFFLSPHQTVLFSFLHVDGNTDERDKTKFEDLHRSIRACDDVLTSVETNLTSFRNDLAAVSADIESLQARSTALNVRLENRRAVEKGLGPIVEELSVSPHVVSKIAEGHVDEAWLKVLAEVDRRSEAHKKLVKAGMGQSRAASDLGPLLEKLTTKVGTSFHSRGCDVVWVLTRMCNRLSRG